MSDTLEPKGILPYSPENYPEKVPEFATEEETRDFWDTHDFSYYWDQFETVLDTRGEFLPDDVRVRSTAKRRPGSVPMESLTIRLSTPEVDGIKIVAERQEIWYQDLLRTWITERLELELAALSEQRVEKKAS